MHWYFTKAVADFLCTSNIVVSHEDEPLCVDWANEANRLELNVCTTDPDEHSLLTNEEHDAMIKGTSFGDMKNLVRS